MHSLRAIMFTDPQVGWNDGEILQATHTKTLNVACSAIANLDRDFSEYVKKSVRTSAAKNAVAMPMALNPKP